jgi:hypothetical protein
MIKHFQPDLALKSRMDGGRSNMDRNAEPS